MLSLMRPRPSGIAFALGAAVVIFQLACPLVIAQHAAQLAVGKYSTQSDAARFRAIARADGTPYRDHAVEYPPLALGLFHAVGPKSFDGFRERLFALQVACQALIVFLLFRFWGRRAAWSYLALSAPMLFVVYNGFDLVGVALAVGGATLVRQRHAVPGALGFVVGAFLKIWPIVLLPSLLVRGKFRAFVTALAGGVLGLAAWTAWGGPSAVGDVVTYRAARGWEYESLPGALLRLLTGDALRYEAGSWRVGAPPKAFGALVTVVLLAAVALIWMLAWSRPDAPDGVAETAAITAVLVFATLLSPQFVIWPIPFVAIAAAAGAVGLERWAAAASVLTLFDWILFVPTHPALYRSELVILGRNAALVGLLITAVVQLRSIEPAEVEPVAV